MLLTYLPITEMWKALLMTVCIGLPVAQCELECYSCMMDGGEQDRWCLTNPTGVSTSTVSCPYNYCSIVRHEYAKGKLFTFYRGCSSGGAQGVAVVSNLKVYTRLCSTSLCNDWDGVAENSTVDHSGSGDQD